MLPALRLSLLAAALALVSAPTALAAPLHPPHAMAALKGLSVPVPTEGQVAVAVARGSGRIKVKSAPAGVTVAGGAKGGRVAVAVVRPRGVAASGKVVLSVRASGVKMFPAALGGGSAGAACKSLGGLLAKRLRGAADTRALAPVLTARLCGKRAPAGAAAVLTRLRLGAPPPPVAAGGGIIGTPPVTRPSGGTTAPPPPAGKACDDGMDNDGDGQVDRADPGCQDAGESETGEVPVSAECAASSGAGQSQDDPAQLFVGINSGCGSFWEVEVDAAPGAKSCAAITSDSSFDCTVHAPVASASAKQLGHVTDLVDMTVELTGPADCATLVTIALHRPDDSVAELVEPLGGCHAGMACANGRDDDGDGMADARDAAGATDPDPGCSGPDDTSEDSEQPLPDGCSIGLGTFGEDPRFPGIAVQGCGTITGVWFKPSAAPLDCRYQVGDDAAGDCAVTGRTIGATFVATASPLLMAGHVAGVPPCESVTVALTAPDGTVLAGHGDWC